MSVYIPSTLTEEAKLATMLDQIIQGSALLQQLTANMQELCTLINKENECLPSIIKLNVGGTIFATTIKTLTSPSSKGSYFEAMFSGRWNSNYSADHGIFIDRDPTLFRHILNYLRGELPDKAILSIPEQKELIVEATYYCLTSMVERLVPVEPCLMFYPGPDYELDHSRQRVISNGHCIVLGPEVIANSVTTICIVTTTTSRIMIGLAPTKNKLGTSYECFTWNKGSYFDCQAQDLWKVSKGLDHMPYDHLEGALAEGGTVGLKYDKNMCVSFVINGKDHGLAYVMKPYTQYCLVLIMDLAGDVVEFVNESIE